MTDPTYGENPGAVVKRSSLRFSKRMPSLSGILTAIIILFLIYAFLSGMTFRFYASFLFFCYSFTKSMWISVVLLGVFQTILLIPFRIIYVLNSNNIKEFVETFEDIKTQEQQQYQFHQNFTQGRKLVLFYSLDFFVQLISYVSIGKLFLTDFYARAIPANQLYDFVPYPTYPIRDIFFKLPYPHITSSKDFGFGIAVLVWLGLLGILLLRRVVRGMIRKNNQSYKPPKIISMANGFLLPIFILVWYLARNFPTGIELSIFSGSVAVANRTLNTVTAVMTFLTLFWHGWQNILRKTELAQLSNIPEKIIDLTQREMFRTTLFSSFLVGLGAYFITNQIPSAFELSIFTLELISLAAPLTLDKMITRATGKLKSKPKNEKKEEHSEDKKEKATEDEKKNKEDGKEKSEKKD
ncbi:hypothetical protein GYA49_02755 [Candidatus Beckwithbacteria bacterium]|nr:hypothetical protein [Candidatus Beckwithbacteria bacterium]